MQAISLPLRPNLLAVALLTCAVAAGPLEPQHGGFSQSFDGPPPALPLRSAHIQYNFDPAHERFFVHIPANYDGKHDFGLIVFIPADNAFTELPRGWDKVLADRKLLFIAPQAAGNDQPVDRRYGLAVLAADEMLVHYRVDPARTFAAGFSGGARIANDLGFYQSDVFRGTIQNCGADFHRPVPQTHPLSPDTPTGDYGLIPASPQEIDNAKQNVRFALITGSRDFRHGNILDLYDGYTDEGFAAKLFDVPDMPHTYCDADTLARAVAFIDASASPSAMARIPMPTSRPAHAAPASRPAAVAPTEAEKHSAQELAMARNYLASNRPDLARPRLQKIIQTYPGTPAAASAQAFLDKLDGQ
jgi:hypothetical protein